MNSLGKVLIALGVVFLASATVSIPNAEDLAYLVGAFLPGLICLIIGLKVHQSSRPDEPIAQRNHQYKSLLFQTNLGIAGGILLMIAGGAIVNRVENHFQLGLCISFLGWACMIWGCVAYMQWKGRSGWFGLLGYLLLPGLIALLCFRNRRKQYLLLNGAEIACESKPNDRAEPKSARYVLTLLPVAVIFLLLEAILLSVGSNVSPDEWKDVAAADCGFQLKMPGNPQKDQKNQPSPAGDVEISKFTVFPKGKKELFMIVVVKFPEHIVNAIGGNDKCLELGRKDVLTAAQGELQSEKRITLDGIPGLELEVLPPKGAIIKSQIFATSNRIFELSVHVPRIRVESTDVKKFFDSFKILSDTAPANN
jgi:hypothetical protein